MYHQTQYLSPLGPLTLASDGAALSGLWIQGQRHFAATAPGPMERDDVLPIFAQARDWLDRYFAGQRPAPDQLPLAPAGTPFRQQVWQLLCQIPWGQTVTYGQLARQMAAQLGRTSMSSQAVGGAVAHNPISIVIPCHRVVGAGGSLTGYAGGLENKLALLRLEGVDTSGLRAP